MNTMEAWGVSPAKCASIVYNDVWKLGAYLKYLLVQADANVRLLNVGCVDFVADLVPLFLAGFHHEVDITPEATTNR